MADLSNFRLLTDEEREDEISELKSKILSEGAGSQFLENLEEGESEDCESFAINQIGMKPQSSSDFELSYAIMGQENLPKFETKDLSIFKEQEGDQESEIQE